MEHVVFDGIIKLSFTKICFLMSFNSKNFEFIMLENQLFKVSIVNFNSTENSSAKEVDFHALTRQKQHPQADGMLFYRKRQHVPA